MTSASRSNKFVVLEMTERELAVEEVNAVDVVKEVVEITVCSGAAKNIWPSRKMGVTRTKATKTVMLAAANGSPMHVEGDAKMVLVRDGKKYNMQISDVKDRWLP